jgi:hypothetical protein
MPVGMISAVRKGEVRSSAAELVQSGEQRSGQLLILILATAVEEDQQWATATPAGRRDQCHRHPSVNQRALDNNVQDPRGVGIRPRRGPDQNRDQEDHDHEHDSPEPSSTDHGPNIRAPCRKSATSPRSMSNPMRESLAWTGRWGGGNSGAATSSRRASPRFCCSRHAEEPPATQAPQHPPQSGEMPTGKAAHFQSHELSAIFAKRRSSSQASTGDHACDATNVSGLTSTTAS